MAKAEPTPTVLDLLREPAFLIGLIVKAALVALVIPKTQLEWFIPFLEGNAFFPALDPWSNHLLHEGNALAFPYGLAMFLVYFPAVAAGCALNQIFDSTIFPFVGFNFTNLCIDLILLLVLRRLLNARLRPLLLFYWLSPILLYVCYWHGQTDLVPVFFLMTALLLLKTNRAVWSGIFLGCAVSAKLSMILAVPFILVYQWRDPRHQNYRIPLLSGFLLILAIIQTPFLFSSGFLTMVLGSREIGKIYNVAIELDGGSKIYLLPMIYMLVLYAAWRLQRLSSELLFALLGIAFFLVLILTPAATGWYLWIVPMLAAFQISTGITTAVLGMAFSLLFVATHFSFSSGAMIPVFGVNLTEPLLNSNQFAHLHSLLITGSCLLGMLISIRMVIHGIANNDYFKLSRKPISLGIAGDSGSGKDTLVAALVELFGSECVSSLSGDDYHKWDRKAPMWKALTHLDPRANNLHSFTQDALALMDGKSVLYRHYDHDTGKFTRTKKLKQNNVVMISGLHTLFVPQLKDKLDVTIYLQMDEDLRHFLKIKRDVEQRGKDRQAVIDSIRKREPDSARYIRPQVENADVVFSVIPVNKDKISDSVANNRYKLKVVLKQGIFYEHLVAKLIGLCGMHVDFHIQERDGAVVMLIEGEASADDIEATARDIVEDMEELISATPTFHDGILGVMQLVTLSQIYDTLKTRVTYGHQYSYN